MPRNGSGTYSLPAGNPVTSGTLIEASWANTTLSDLSSAMTDSLARSGEGGMTGPLRSTDGSVSVPSQSFVNETSSGFYRAAATDVRFAMAGVDIATLTTGGLTVGSSKILSLPDGSAAAPALTNTGDTNTGVFFPDADTVAVSTGGTERMRLTSGGNLLLSSSGARIQGDFSNATVGNRTFFQDKTTNNATSVGAIPNGTGAESSFAAFGVSDSANSTYLTIASGSNYTKLESGKTGTASYAPLTFNVGGAEAARFTTSGNFQLLGTGQRIQGDFSNVAQTNRTAFQDKTTNNVTSISALPNGTATAAGYNAYNNSDPTNSGYIGFDISSTLAKINSSAIGSGTALPLTFNVGAGGPEVARFTTAGQFLTGTTNASSTAGIGIKLNPDPAAPWVATVGSDNSGTNGSYYLYSTSTGSYRFYVLYNGTVNAVSTTITAISDARLKENIRDLDAGLPQIMALKPRRFDWKPGKGKDKKDDWGWIAQEFEQTFPEMIQTWKDPAPEGEEPYKAVNADLIPILVKAMQEQQALIVSLEARVAALEAA